MCIDISIYVVPGLPVVTLVSVVYLGRKSQFVSHCPGSCRSCWYKDVHESLKENIGETVAQFLRASQTINSAVQCRHNVLGTPVVVLYGSRTWILLQIQSQGSN